MAAAQTVRRVAHRTADIPDRSPRRFSRHCRPGASSVATLPSLPLTTANGTRRRNPPDAAGRQVPAREPYGPGTDAAIRVHAARGEVPVLNPIALRRRFRRPRTDGPTSAAKHWTDLCGTWDFAFDPGARGLDEGWQQSSTTFPDRNAVPFPWQSLATWGHDRAAEAARFFFLRAYLDPAEQPGEPVLCGRWHDDRGRARRQEIGWYRRGLRCPRIGRCRTGGFSPTSWPGPNALRPGTTCSAGRRAPRR